METHDPNPNPLPGSDAPGTSSNPFTATIPPSPGELMTVNKEQRVWALAAHLSALAGLVIPVIGNIVPPLIIWAIKKDEMPFVADQAKEALNFQITVTIFVAICVVFFFLIVPIFVAIAAGIAALILTIIAAIKANEGVAYRYPLALRLVK